MMKPVSTRDKITLELVGGMSPQAVQRDRQLANTQFGEATSGAPVQHWTQALNRVAQGLGSSMRETRAATAEHEAATLQRQALTDALAGGDLGNAATTLLNNAGTADQGAALAGKVIADRQAQARSEAERNRPLTPMQQADLEYKRAQTDNLRRDDGSKIITVNGRVLSVAPDGTATEVFNAQPQPDQGTDDIQEYRFAVENGYKGSFMDYMAAKKGGKTAPGDDPSLTANIAGGLERLRGVPEEFGSTFDNAVGPWQGDPKGGIVGSIARALGSVYEGVTNYQGTQYTSEVRNRIEADTQALAASIVPLIRPPGSGPWTDADAQRLDNIMGNLAQSRNEQEYMRNLGALQQRITSNFGIQLPPLGSGGGRQPAAGAPTPAGSVMRARNPQTGEVIESSDGGQTWRRAQ